MVFPWGNSMSSDNGQGIEYLLKKSSDSWQIQCLVTTCVMACARVGVSVHLVPGLLM